MSRFGCLSIITTYIFLSNNHLWSSSFKKYHHFSVFSVFIFSPILTYWAISQLLGSAEKSHITNLFLYWPQLTFLRIKKFDVSPVYKSTETTTVKNKPHPFFLVRSIHSSHWNFKNVIREQDGAVLDRKFMCLKLTSLKMTCLFETHLF